MQRRAVTPSPPMKKHAKSTRAAARVYQEKLRAQELQAHKARTKGKALYTDGDLKAVMLDILEDPRITSSRLLEALTARIKSTTPAEFRGAPPATGGRRSSPTSL